MSTSLTPPDGVALSAESLDPDDDFYRGLEENDDDIVAEKVAQRPLSQRSPRWMIAIAIIAGIVIGVWYAGKPDTTGVADGSGLTGSDAQVTMPGADFAADQKRISELNEILSADPANAEAHLELGVLYFNQLELEEAAQQWQMVIALDPDNATAWYNLGFYYLSLSPADMAAAASAWDKVIELDPGSSLADTVRMHLSGLSTETDSDQGSQSGEGSG